MKILFDQGTPVPLREYLVGHVVETAFERGWSTLENGALLSAAEDAFDVLITTDQNLRSQQNLTGHKLTIMVLTTTSWPRIKESVPQIVKALDALHPGEYVEISPP